MENDKLLELIKESKMVISSGYKYIDSCTSFTEDVVLEFYKMLDKEEEKLDRLIALYHQRTGKKLIFDEAKGDYLFEDVKPVQIDEGVKSNKKNSSISGNVRLATGRWRTAEQQKEYIDESLERELP
ncbi:MAG: hypothetical protein IJX25_04455 [Clostridia bacterium]|nr:hypothetical protein [Clostridia bacterium]MBQ8792501.1 hypothetical protein [Clostridia bacterium]